VKYKIKYEGKIFMCESIPEFVEENLPEVIGYKKGGKIFDLMTMREIIRDQENNPRVTVSEISQERLGQDMNKNTNNNQDDCIDMTDMEFFSTKSTDGLFLIRHSLAHLMAHAIRDLYSKVSLGHGPVTENGFFYDFQGITISTKDFSKIEKKMQELIKMKIDIIKYQVPKHEFSQHNGDPLKQIILDGISESTVSIYQQGDFSDLCKGPHVPNTSFLPLSFKISEVSEVLWKDKKVQRVKAIAFQTEDQIENFQKMQKSNEEHDHRKIGKKMDLFSFCELSPGMVFWHPNGLKLVKKLKEIVIKQFSDYREISTPEIFKKDLWKLTGHLDQYSDYMFLMEDYGVKPMNCPAHMIFFNHELRSHKSLPFRIFEFGSCFRNEDEGGLMGLKRVRKLVQDDGHILCSQDQIYEETKIFLEKSFSIYDQLGFKDKYKIKIATRPTKSIGTAEEWQKAEEILFSIAREMKINFDTDSGGGAFYGPKIEIHIQDRMGRWWQCGTIQVDFFIAKNMDVSFVNQKSDRENPIVLHRASLGSLERFIALLLEHYDFLPMNLHPMPINILPVGADHHQYAEDIKRKIIKHFDCQVLSEGSISKRIKNSIESRTPYILIVGEKEVAEKTISIRNGANTICETVVNFLHQLSENN
jgi:threonyl-tRNA synthetase